MPPAVGAPQSSKYVYEHNAGTYRIYGGRGWATCTLPENQGSYDEELVFYQTKTIQQQPEGDVPCIIYKTLGGGALYLVFSTRAYQGNYPMWYSKDGWQGYYRWEHVQTHRRQPSHNDILFLQQNNIITVTDNSVDNSTDNSDNSNLHGGIGNPNINIVIGGPVVNANANANPVNNNNLSGAGGGGAGGDGGGGGFGIGDLIELGFEVAPFVLAAALTDDDLPPGSKTVKKALKTLIREAVDDSSATGFTMSMPHEVVAKIHEFRGNPQALIGALGGRQQVLVPFLSRYADTIKSVDVSNGKHGAVLHYDSASDTITISPQGSSSEDIPDEPTEQDNN